MERFEAAFVGANRLIVAGLLCATFLVVIVNVVLRYGFGTSLAWGEETARFLMIAGTFLGAGLALRDRQLVAIELLQDIVPPHLRRVIRIVVAIVVLVFMGVLVWIGAEFASFGWDKQTMATGISRGIPYLAIPVGAAVLCVHLLLGWRRFVWRSEEAALLASQEGTP